MFVAATDAGNAVTELTDVPSRKRAVSNPSNVPTIFTAGRPKNTHVPAFVVDISHAHR